MSYTQDKWDRRFLELARHVANWSKDKSTKVGAVIVGEDHEIRSTGYNGLPRGARDDNHERDVRPEKLLWYEHAERNAIYNAARFGTPLQGCILYSSLCPCMDCARGIIQAGISGVVCPRPDLVKYSMWADQFKKTEILLTECNVGLIYSD